MGSKKQKEAKEKPLEKMTSKELRELAKGIEGVVGVHGMNKVELVSIIKKARGIEDSTPKGAGDGVRELKLKIKELKAKRASFIESKDDRMAAIYRKRIIRLKKKTRRLD